MSGNIPLGFIPHLGFEAGVIVDFMTEAPRKYDEAFKGALRENSAKKKAAQELLSYTKLPYSKRVREVDFFQEVPKEDWEKIVRTLREYVVP